MKNFPNLKCLEIGNLPEDFNVIDFFKFLKNNSLENDCFMYFFVCMTIMICIFCIAYRSSFDEDIKEAWGKNAKRREILNDEKA